MHDTLQASGGPFQSLEQNMAQFVLVASGISSENFEKAMEVKIRSGGKVSFVPQTVNQNGAHTMGMSSAKPNANGSEVLNIVRFEWGHDGEEFGAELVRALAGHHHQHEQRHEPAA
jgi:hypothetical protein